MAWASPPDSDGDGMPDDWEGAYGLNPEDPDDAALDADGDTLTNLEEYRLGTDPTDAASNLRITQIALNGGQAMLQFTARAGHSYTVERSTNLVVWATIANVVASSSSTFSVMDNAAFARAFYRVHGEFGIFGINAVGYINLAVGTNLITNPFRNSSYLLNDLLPTVPDGTLLWNVGTSGFEQNFFDGFEGLWYDLIFFTSTTTLRPGEGALLVTPAPFVQTFLGELLEGPLTNKLPAGLSLCGSIVPQSGGLSSVLGFPVEDGDVIYKFNSGTQSYDSYLYDEFAWTPSEPVMAAGEAFWADLGSSRNWVRQFSVSGRSGSPYSITNFAYMGNRGGIVPGPVPKTSILVDGTERTGPVSVTNSAQVQITTTITNAVIFYTLNAAYPGTGPFYQAPFTITQSSTVRALAYSADFSQLIESATVVVTVVNGPTILQQPQPQTNLVGQTASFHVAAAGSPTLLYQWSKDQQALAAATNDTLVLGNVQLSDAGQYRVAVRNSYGSVTSAPALLGVFTLPQITMQPQSVVVPVNSFVSFSVGATGTGPLRYQWRQNGVNIPGATNASYTMPVTQIADGGSYTVVVANDYGTVLSAPATLTIVFTFLPPSDAFAGAVSFTGTNVILSASSGTATKELGEPNHAGKPGGRSVWYQWQAPTNGIVSLNMRGSTFDTLLAIYTGTNLTNLNVVASNDDNENEAVNPLTSALQFFATAGVTYRIAIDGSGGSGGWFILSFNFEPREDTAPTVTQQPRTTAVVGGSNAVFTVVAAGTPTLFYQWHFNGQSIPGATNSTLVVSNAQLANVGLYGVQVMNGIGAYNSAQAGLELVSRPTEPTSDKFEDLNTGVPPGGLVNSNPKGPPTLLPVSAGIIGYDFFDNTYSSGSPFDPAHCAIGGASRWLAFLPDVSGTMVVDTVGSEVATVIAVFRAARLTDLNTANFVACDINSAPDGHSLVRFPVLAGATYSVLIDGLNAAKGRILFHYCLGATPQVTSSGAPQIIREGNTIFLSAGIVPGIPPATYQWYRDGVALTGANGLTYSQNNVVNDAAGIYSLVASNCLGLSSNVVARVTVEVPLHMSFLATRVGNQFNFHLTGTASHGLVVQATTNFLNWIPLYTNATPYSPINFVDPASAFQPLRFYRAMPWPP